MSNPFLELALLIILILLNGFFSLSEIALLSARKSRLLYFSRQGSRRAKAALTLVGKSPEMLSAIQIGITAIGIFAGAFGGTTLAEHIEGYIQTFPTVAQYSGPISVVIVVILITYFSLIVGELVPKQIALSNPERLAILVARPIRLVMKIAHPLVKILSASTGAMLRLLRIKPSNNPVITEEEIKLLVAEGTETGVFAKSEQKMVGSIFHMGNRPIKDFMTPRAQVVWIDINDSIATIKEKIAGSDRSVFPVCEGSLDHTLGAVEVKDIFLRLFYTDAPETLLKKLIQPVLRIDSDAPSLVAIERLKRSPISIAMITEKANEKTVGIISFHDILEEIVGEFKHA